MDFNQDQEFLLKTWICWLLCFGAFLATCIFMYFIGKYSTSLMARILTAPNYVLVTCILFVSLIGVYASKGNSFDLWLALIVGIIVFFLNKLDFAAPLFVLAFIFGPMTEDYFRRSLMLSKGEYNVFYTGPTALILICLILLVFGFSTYRSWKNNSKPTDSSVEKGENIQ
ncbi:tripartite tricarboxylate transporter permease [Metabacillus endolithicus]|nr:tripartite tricarboxylate transporter permease [Metabacillus endolithicus]UPG62518.1 tripartite tricarboxylate transporter permease [Metabacillus endolithicus]